jgi:glucokinase
VTGRRVIGIDAGGTKLLGGVVDEGLAVHHRVHRLWRGGARQEVLDVLVDVVEEALAAGPEADAIGFGIPSLMDRDRAFSRECVHLPLAGVPFRDLMSERLDRPVVVDNDANCALLAEARAGAAQGARGALLLTLGTGIGGGVLVDGAIYRGPGGSAGELGHVVVEVDGRECPCGNRGCLETVVSGTAIGAAAAEIAEADPESAIARARTAGRDVTGALVTELAGEGDPDALAILAEAGRKLGAGLSGLANAFNPEVIVIGGGASAAGELLLGPAREELGRRALGPNRGVAVVPAHFGPEAGMLGAAVLALEEGVR